jgi:hypothetical protein
MEMLVPPTFRPRISPFEAMAEQARHEHVACQTAAEKAKLRFFQDICQPEVSLDRAWYALNRRRTANHGGAHGR